jgi:hypothetical protein
MRLYLALTIIAVFLAFFLGSLQGGAKTKIKKACFDDYNCVLKVFLPNFDPKTSVNDNYRKEVCKYLAERSSDAFFADAWVSWSCFDFKPSPGPVKK